MRSKVLFYSITLAATERGFMAHFSHIPQASHADMHSEDEEESWSGSEDWPEPESESDSEDQYELLRYRASDPRDATFRPGVGPFIAHARIILYQEGGMGTPIWANPYSVQSRVPLRARSS